MESPTSLMEDMADLDYVIAQDEGPTYEFPPTPSLSPHIPPLSPSSYGFPQGKARDFFFPRRAQSCRISGPPNRLQKMPKPSISIPTLSSAKPRPGYDLNSPLSPSLSPRSPGASSTSQMSGPPSPYKTSTIRSVGGHKKSATETLTLQSLADLSKGSDKTEEVTHHTVTAIPQLPPSPLEPPKTSSGREGKSFFSNLKASKSSHKLQPNEQAPADHPLPKSRGSSKERPGYPISRGNQSTPDLSATIPEQGTIGQCFFPSMLC